VCFSCVCGLLVCVYCCICVFCLFVSVYVMSLSFVCVYNWGGCVVWALVYI